MEEGDRRVRESFEDATLLPLKVEEGACTKNVCSLQKLKRQGNVFSLKTSKRNVVLITRWHFGPTLALTVLLILYRIGSGRLAQKYKKSSTVDSEAA